VKTAELKGKLKIAGEISPELEWVQDFSVASYASSPLLADSKEIKYEFHPGGNREQKFQNSLTKLATI
jgi:hypothetical protein